MPNSFAIGSDCRMQLCGSRRPGPGLLLVGDGGFLLSATELATVAQEELPIVVIVFVDVATDTPQHQEFQYGSEEVSSE